MKKKFFLLFLIGVILLTFSYGKNFEGYLYGTVYTADGEEIEGIIQWGDEEIFWDDNFNSNKVVNKNIKNMSKKDIDKFILSQKNKNKSEIKLGNTVVKIAKFLDIIEVNDTKQAYSQNFIHTFECQFGNVKQVIIKDEDRVEIKLKNDEYISLEGGSNDIGADITVYNDDIGKTVYKWDFVEKVEFYQSPKKDSDDVGKPLYGQVVTDEGLFEGFIIWDRDERLSINKLDGDSKGNKYSIDFGNIKLIEKKNYGSEVVLKSGRELQLSNSNDVNDENRGIIVKTKYHRVVIPWSEFKEVVFKDYPEEYKKYTDYDIPENLSGKIYSQKDNINYNGKFVFDLDEEYDFEIFHGKDDNGLEYLIPFKNIKKIERINSNTCMMNLKDGSSIRLGNSQDSSDDNNGILLTDSEVKDSRYIGWESINYIELD